MTVSQLFAYDSVMCKYDTRKETYCNAKSTTRRKSIVLPKITNEAINYNSLPTDLKTLKISRKDLIQNEVVFVIHQPFIVTIIHDFDCIIII